MGLLIKCYIFLILDKKHNIKMIKSLYIKYGAEDRNRTGTGV